MSSKLATIIADFETQLSTKLIAGGNSCNIQSNKDDDTVTLPNGIYFFTIDGDNNQKEHIVATLTGTALSGIKSISRQGIQTANALREHRVGASVKITDFAHIMYINDILRGTTGFDSAVKIGYDADAGINSSDLDKFSTVRYVNSVAIAGAPDASTTVKGIVEEATSVEIDSDTAAGALARLFINPLALSLSKYGIRLPTINEKAAMVGSSGLPTSGNPFLTLDDATAYGVGLSQLTQNLSYAVGEADSTTKNNRVCQSFIAINTSVNAVYLYKQTSTGTNAGNVLVEIYAVDVSNNPTGSALISATVLAATWNGYANGLNYISLGGTLALTVGTTYALVVRQSTADNANHINLGVASTDVYSGGTLKRFATADGWVSTTGDMTFQMMLSTNNKIARRGGSGEMPVPLTPVNTTDATSKSYVDVNVGEKVQVATTDVQVSATATETALVSATIPGGMLLTNNSIFCRLNLTTLTSGGGETLTLRFKYGATTLVTLSLISPGSSIGSPGLGIIEFNLFASGATNSQEGIGRIVASASSVSANNAISQIFAQDIGTSAIDSTVNQTLTITAQWTGSNGSNNITISNSFIEKIR